MEKIDDESCEEAMTIIESIFITVHSVTIILRINNEVIEGGMYHNSIKGSWIRV